MMFKRNTIVSQKVYELLKQAKHAVSVSELLNLLNESGLTPNKTTVYRILEKLHNQKVVQVVNLKTGGRYYEMTTGHHHHFFCYDCETLYCLEGCQLATKPVAKYLPPKQFKMTDHDLNYYGVCAPCNPEKEEQYA